MRAYLLIQLPSKMFTMDIKYVHSHSEVFGYESRI